MPTGWHVVVDGDTPLDVEIHSPVPRRRVGRDVAQPHRPSSGETRCPAVVAAAPGSVHRPSCRRSSRRCADAHATVAAVVGNPKARSRTLAVADAVAVASAHAAGLSDAPRRDDRAGGPRPQLFDWSSADVRAAVETVCHSTLAVVASPTYKASYTGLLKSYLDWFGTTDLVGVTVVPVMVGAGPAPRAGGRGPPASRPRGAGRVAADPRPLRHRGPARRVSTRSSRPGWPRPGRGCGPPSMARAPRNRRRRPMSLLAEPAGRRPLRAHGRNPDERRARARGIGRRPADHRPASAPGGRVRLRRRRGRGRADPGRRCGRVPPERDTRTS